MVDGRVLLIPTKEGGAEHQVQKITCTAQTEFPGWETKMHVFH